MPATVQILPQTLINQIAAGEVIVRPASVIKELAENSLDAGATRIRVEISQDSRSITIIDDGSGMDEQNARIAILRHSTSKIHSLEDLERIATRGFRGEAVASIIAVSRFELITQPHGALAGTRLLASGGRVERVEPVGAAPGTTMHVRDLFFNTPARLKFLKTAAAEFNAAVEILTQQALSCPDVGFTLVRAGETRFDLPPGQTLKQRIETLLGSAVHGQLLEVRFERAGLTVRGYICRPEAARKDRRWQYLLVNGRPIAARQLAYPIQEAYLGLLMKQRFPVVVLDIGIDLAEVDVNVHPTKEEVRFEDERKVAGLLYRAINQTLLDNNLVPTLDTLPDAAPTAAPRTTQAPAPAPPAFYPPSGEPVPIHPAFAPAPPPHSSSGFPPPTGPAPRAPMQSPPSGSPPRSFAPVPRFADPADAFLRSPKGVAPFRPGMSFREINPPGTAAPSAQRDMIGPYTEPAPEPVPSQPGLAAGTVPCAGPPETPLALDNSLRPLGQIDNTYIVAELHGDLVLVDQHAAHERLLHKRLCETANRKSPTQPLLVPLTFRPAAGDQENLASLLPVLEEMGLEIERQPGGEYAILALPADLDTLDAEAMIQDSLDDLRQREEPGLPALDALREKARVYAACHAAIKAGQRLSPPEIAALLRDLTQAGPPYRCPHGRPALIVLKKDALEKMFGRKQ